MTNNSKKICILIIFLFLACKPKPFFSRDASFSGHRSINSETSVPKKCKRDHLTLEESLRQIEEIEKQNRNNNTPKSYRYSILDNGNEVEILLDNLNTNQFAFISQEYVKPEPTESDLPAFLQCRDFQCFLTNGVGHSELAAKVYLFFLKSGYTLSLSRNIPNVSKMTDTPFKEHLFQQNEVDAFIRLSNALPESMLRMKSLQTFHRVPPQRTIWGGNTCGDATGNSGFGFIRLGDGCLQLSKNDVQFESFFYEAITHEIAHRLDSGRLSESEDWKKLSGWFCGNMIDTNTGNISYRCTAKNPNEFVSSYAKVSPAEDFADSLAYYRFKPEILNQKSPNKWNYFNKNVFAQKGYLKPDLIDYYSSISSLYFSEKLADSAKKCFSTEENLVGQRTSNVSWIISDEVEPKRKLCMMIELDTILQQSVAKIEELEMDACDLNLEKNSQFFMQVANKIQNNVNNAIFDQPNAHLLRRFIQKFNSELINELDSREVYLNCMNEMIPKNCYLNNLSKEFDLVLNKVKATTSELVELDSQWLDLRKNVFFRENEFSETENRIKIYFKNLFPNLGNRLSLAGNNLWESCLVEPEKVQGNGLKNDKIRFDLKEGFLRREVLNCLSVSLPYYALDALKKEASRVGIVISRTEVQDLILQEYAEFILNSLYLKHKNLVKLELQRLESEFNTINVRGDWITSESFWNFFEKRQSISRLLQSSEQLFSFTGACELLMSFEHNSEFNLKVEDLSTKFISLSSGDIRKNYFERTCEAVVKEADFSNLNTMYLTALSKLWEGAMSELGLNIQNSASDWAVVCKKSSGPSKKNIQSCLIKSWSQIENQALSVWKQSAFGLIYKNKLADVQKHVQQKKTENQRKALNLI